MGWIAAILSLFISTAAMAQAALPPTPSGRVLAELLDAFNSGDPDMAEAFDRTYQPRDPRRPAASSWSRSRQAMPPRSRPFSGRRTVTASQDCNCR
ncbi:hypothetical protein EDC40_101515 [Aminobacter aminovorans]|uniref:Uncharacterized protein n=1 Tax=Aminobacter aminovorans TaxID=83263 RepID=A0A380WRX6_AMIAI|nr:hypothetical protein EDC40_101515 [Aminobacter aminovorans]SUU91046.1 Uncharacterised protein [Aminobacter aminovorans]